MDILRFINSSVIRRYLGIIHYEFNQNEIAWLIYQCNSISFDEKKAAWGQLMEEYEDEPLQERCNLDDCTLFEAIKKYIALKDNYYQEFLKKESKTIYSYEFYCPGDMSFCEEFDNKYSTYEKCWDAIREDMDLGMTRIIIRKEYLDGEAGRIEVEFKQDESGEWVVYDIYSCGIKQEEIPIEEFLWKMYFEFPDPFFKGDIVYIPQKDCPYFEEEKVAFVYERACYEECNDFMKTWADSTDMRAIGYFMDDDGTIFKDSIGNCMDLEYYEKPFEGPARILKAVSSFKKGLIDVDLLLAAYKKFSLEEISKENLTCMYTEKQLIRASIIQEETDNGKEE